MSEKPKPVDEAALERILGNGITRLTPEAKLIVLSALQEAKERKGRKSSIDSDFT